MIAGCVIHVDITGVGAPLSVEQAQAFRYAVLLIGQDAVYIWQIKRAVLYDDRHIFQIFSDIFGHTFRLEGRSDQNHSLCPPRGQNAEAVFPGRLRKAGIHNNTGIAALLKLLLNKVSAFCMMRRANVRHHDTHNLR